MTDTHYMQMALKLAEKNLGNVAPNPSVGCVLVKNSSIIGEGCTAFAGRPHAETTALQNASESPIGATMYVTLEPCCHYGVTGPCSAKIIEAGIKRVVVAATDPDTRVSGGGIRALREAGIRVDVNVLREEAENLNVGFFTVKTRGRPFVTCKVATTMDGKIATFTGDSKWITGEDTRNWVHELRSTYDAIMIGSNTLVNDDPLLTCRLPGLEDRSPIRFVVDSGDRVKSTHNLVKTADRVKTYIVSNREPSMRLQDVEYLIVDSNLDGKVCLKDLMSKLAQLGITRLLVEGGGELITELLKHNLIDRFIVCRSGKILGSDGTSFVNHLNIKAIKDCRTFRKSRLLEFAEDVVEYWDIKP